MRWRVVTLGIVLAGVLASAAAAVSPPIVIEPVDATAPTPTALSATLSSRAPGARPVALALTFPAPLVCGRPAGSMTVRLPAAASVPAQIATTAISVNGLVPGKVAVDGHSVTVRAAVQKGIMCHSVAEGTLRLTFTRAAGIGNPARAGRYAISVQRATQTLHATVAIGR